MSEEVHMQKLMKKIEDIMVAITFAEASEYDTATRLLSDSKQAADETELKAHGVQRLASGTGK